MTVAGLGIYAGILQWLNEQPARGPAPTAHAWTTEVLVARQGVTPTSPDQSPLPRSIYEKRLKEMRAENQTGPSSKVRSGPAQPTGGQGGQAPGWLTLGLVRHRTRRFH